MNQIKLELWVGLFVAIGIAALFMLALKVSNLTSISTGNTYQVTVEFDNIGGLNVRSPVKAGGVLVGRVSKISYDDKKYVADVTLSIQENFDRFPVDSRASIYTAGLLGEQYVELVPGFSETYLKQGSHIVSSDSAMILEKLVGKVVDQIISK